MCITKGTPAVVIGILVLVGGLAGCAANSQSSDGPPAERSAEDEARLKQALRAMDAQYAGFLPWLACRYDPASGGFYESRATEAQGYAPDIQSTAQALTMMQYAGVSLRAMPDTLREDFIAFFQERQDPETGFFVDPDYPAMRKSDRVLGRALGYSVNTLHMLGAEPPYPLPGGQEKETALPAHLQSAEAFRQWLDEHVGYDPGWGEMDLLASQAVILKSLPAERQERLVEIAYEYAIERQNEETGLWQDLDGTFKFARFADKLNLPVPHARQIYKSTMQWFRTHETVGQTPRLGNPIRLLVMLQPHLPGPMPTEDVLFVLRWYEEAMQDFKQADGAFSRYKDQFALRPNDLSPPVGRAKRPQSDMNGTKMVVNVRERAYDLAGVEMPPLPGAGTFYEYIGQCQE